MKLDGAQVLITGGSSGLGLALTKALVKKNAVVHVVSRTKKKLDKARSELPKGSAFFYQANVASHEDILDVVAQLDRLDILINNAGIFQQGPVVAESWETIHQVIATNLTGMILTTKACMPLLQQAPAAHIVNVSSTNGMIAKPLRSVYVASKHGVTGFTKALQLELEQTAIKVSGIYPSTMKTPFFEAAGHACESRHWLDVAKVAATIVFMLEQDDALIMEHVVVNKSVYDEGSNKKMA